MASTTDNLFGAVGAFVVLLAVAYVGLGWLGISFTALTPRTQTGLVGVLAAAAVYLAVN